MQLISLRTGFSLLLTLAVFIGIACGDFGNASASAGQRPAAPTGLVASTISSSEISLTWTDNATTEIGYLVQRSHRPNRDFRTIRKLPADSAQYVAKSLRASRTYYFRVVAYRGHARSRSEIVTAVTAAPSYLYLHVHQLRRNVHQLERHHHQLGRNAPPARAEPPPARAAPPPARAEPPPASAVTTTSSGGTFYQLGRYNLQLRRYHPPARAEPPPARAEPPPSCRAFGTAPGKAIPPATPAY